MRALPKTFLAEGQTGQAEIIDFVKVLESRGRTVGPPHASIVSPDGDSTSVPRALYEPLLAVARALADGHAVTVAPLDSQLTTQGAADYLGISRPTLVKLLETGEIPFTKINSHRRLILSDLLDYEERVASHRRAALAELSESEYREGVVDATDGPVPPMR